MPGSEWAPQDDLQRAHQLLGIGVRPEDPAAVVSRVAEWCSGRESRVVVCAAVLTANLARWSTRFRKAVESADHITPDGVPLVWVLTLCGLRDAERVYGPDLALDLCAMAEDRGFRIGLLGGRDEVRMALARILLERWPKLRIEFSESPPFRRPTAREEARLCQRIRSADVQLLLVGLGCPKQELWMARNRDRVSCVSVGVGAGFDFIAGNLVQAPTWVQRAGLEWLFRLAAEPRRLWRRYLLGNPAFLLALSRRALFSRRGVVPPSA